MSSKAFTRRELDVVSRYVGGAGKKQIMHELRLSLSTVFRDIRHASRKLGARNEAQLGYLFSTNPATRDHLKPKESQIHSAIWNCGICGKELDAKKIEGCNDAICPVPKPLRATKT